MTSYPDERVLEAGGLLKRRLPSVPAVGVILGSGLGELVEETEDPIRIPYADIPYFPLSSVKGHAGEAVVGGLSGRPFFALSGRVHSYEGYPWETLVFPIRVMAFIGVETVIVTNAAGGINRDFSPGDIILITGHIDLMRIISPDPAPRIQGSEDVYDPMMRKQAACAAAGVGVTLKTGVYAAVTGPSYETPAEIRALRFLGADMVGMSTVPEATEAKRLGMKVLGLSFIANPAAGLNRNPLSHHDVIETSARHLPVFKKVLKQVIKALQAPPEREHDEHLRTD